MVDKLKANYNESQIKPLITDQSADKYAEELKELLEQDKSKETQIAIKSNFFRELCSLGHWFHRIDLPDYGITTTSNHSLVKECPVGLMGTLGGRLTNLEGTILRPLPKWKYILPNLPDVRGKTVLDVGSANGFFAMEFAKLSAKRVTAVEGVPMYAKTIQWVSQILRLTQVNVENTDILFDLKLKPHDIVFCSAVTPHFVGYFYGILRLLKLAKEWLIIDDVIFDTFNHSLNLGLFGDKTTGKLGYHGWVTTVGLLMDFLYMCGIEPSRIIRYKAPWEHHSMFVIDTSDIETGRDRLGTPRYLEDALNLNFRTK